MFYWARIPFASLFLPPLLPHPCLLLANQAFVRCLPPEFSIFMPLRHLVDWSWHFPERIDPPMRQSEATASGSRVHRGSSSQCQSLIVPDLPSSFLPCLGLHVPSWGPPQVPKYLVSQQGNSFLGEDSYGHYCLELEESVTASFSSHPLNPKDIFTRGMCWAPATDIPAPDDILFLSIVSGTMLGCLSFTV